MDYNINRLTSYQKWQLIKKNLKSVFQILKYLSHVIINSYIVFISKRKNSSNEVYDYILSNVAYFYVKHRYRLF